jgi:DNA-binding response OmpR family regulator
LRILLVDDEPDITRAVKLGLQMNGFKVDIYNDPAEALRSFKPDRYDIALLDVRMPEINGFQLYRELLKRDGKIKVKFFTAFEEYRAEFNKAFPELDTTRFIKKPTSLKNLASILTDELQRSSSP